MGYDNMNKDINVDIWRIYEKKFTLEMMKQSSSKW